MRFKELLAENSFMYEKEIAKILYNDCEPWLDATNGEIVYRGIKKYPEHLYGFVKPVRGNRDPLDTPSDRHDILNTLIKQAGGIANRSNSMFVTSSPGVASHYGRVFAVFPIGNFNYTWSPIWADWHNDLTWSAINSLLKKPNDITHTDAYVDVVTKIKKLVQNPDNVDLKSLKEGIRVNEGLAEAIAESQEIMIQCDSALYIGTSSLGFIRQQQGAI